MQALRLLVAIVMTAFAVAFSFCALGDLVNPMCQTKGISLFVIALFLGADWLAIRWCLRGRQLA